MKPFYLLGLLLLLACASFKETPYSFQDGWNHMKSLDDKYGSDLRKERMDRDFVDVKQTDAFQQDLDAFRQRLLRDSDSLDRKKLLWLVDARKQMLESERFYQLALKLDIFTVPDEVAICTKQSQMELVYKYYKSAIVMGVNATTFLDGVLQDFEPAKKLLGIDDTKPAFYNSKWDETNLLLTDLAQVLNECAGFKSQRR